MDRTTILHIDYHPVTRTEALALAMESMETGRKCRCITANAEHDLLCRGNPHVRKAINEAQLIFPDGISVMIAGKITGRRLPEKIPGADFALDLCRLMEGRGKRLFLYGAAPGVAEEAAENLKKQFPRLLIAGLRDGYRKDDEGDAAYIQSCKADALFVCRGAPAQELFMAQYQDKLDCPFLIGLGGSLDVFAGRVERAPEGWRRLNLEWLYRLLRQPSRIKRMIKLPLYLLNAVFWRMGGCKNG